LLHGSAALLCVLHYHFKLDVYSGFCHAFLIVVWLNAEMAIMCGSPPMNANMLATITQASPAPQTTL
jgi:hypothetical protein